MRHAVENRTRAILRPGLSKAQCNSSDRRREQTSLTPKVVASQREMLCAIPRKADGEKDATWSTVPNSEVLLECELSDTNTTNIGISSDI